MNTMTYTPLVMSLHPRPLNNMLKGRKDIEVRRIIPADTAWRDNHLFVRPLYFVRTFSSQDDPRCYRTVKIRCEVEAVHRVDLHELYPCGEETDELTCEEIEYSPMDPPGFYHPALTWRQAFKYQGDRPFIYFLLLRNVREVDFSISALGLEYAPQSFAWAKKVPDFEKEFLNER